MTGQKYPESWSLVVAANNQKVLETTLLRSPDLINAREVVIERNPFSASTGYNEGLRKSSGDVIVFAHQDVFFPAGWAKSLLNTLATLSSSDPDWAVGGVYGITATGQGAGYVYSTGLRRFVGKAYRSAIQVRTIDEMVIIVRRSSGLTFDENLPGFHLYGADICLNAEACGYRNYVLPCFSLHNSIGIRYLPVSFWRAYLYLRKKWISQLPVVTPCTTISYSCLPIARHFIERIFALMMKKTKVGSRVVDPSRFYMENIAPAIER